MGKRNTHRILIRKPKAERFIGKRSGEWLNELKWTVVLWTVLIWLRTGKVNWQNKDKDGQRLT